MVAQDIGFCDAEARRWQQARALTRRRGNLVALNRGPPRRAMGIWVLRRPRFSGPVEARIRLERPSRCSGRCDGPASPFSLMQCAIREAASTGKLHVETMLRRSRKCCGSLRERNDRHVAGSRAIEAPATVRSGMGGVKGLDDSHPAAAARTWRRLDGCLGLIGAADAFGFRRRRWDFEPFSAKRQVLDATAVGEEAVVPNAMECRRQHMHQEPAHELADGKRHDLVLASAMWRDSPSSESGRAHR